MRRQVSQQENLVLLIYTLYKILLEKDIARNKDVLFLQIKKGLRFSIVNKNEESNTKNRNI